MDILDDSNLSSGGYEPAAPLLSNDENYGEMIPPSRLRRSRRLQRTEPHLNITSFVDVLSVLLFFLLSVATLDKLGAHDVALPQQTEKFTESTMELKNLSVSLAHSGLKLRGMITPQGKPPEVLNVDLPIQNDKYDLDKLQQELLRIKGTYKTDDAIILMVGDDVHFDWIVKVMDTVREKVVYANGAQQVTKLFPQVSLSDYLVDSQA